MTHFHQKLADQGKVAGKRPNRWSKQVCPDAAVPYRLEAPSQMDKALNLPRLIRPFFQGSATTAETNRVCVVAIS